MPKHRTPTRKKQSRVTRRKKYLQDFAALDTRAQQSHYSAILHWLIDALARGRKTQERRVVGTENRFQ